jgi:uncharacterized membrane protein
MDSSPTPQVVRTYLDQLEATLAGVREDVRHDIVAGIAEELRGLSAAEAAARIEALGDPAFIAAEARAEDAASATAEPGAAAPKPTEAASAASGDARWYVVLAALLVAVGGVVVPVIGWIVGIALVWLSRTWDAWEKWVATLTGFAAVAVAGLIDLVTLALHPGGIVGMRGTLVLGVLTNLIVGIWLLWRAQGRTSRER